MENLFISLILAALPGLAFIAYRHPEGFEPIFKILLRGSLIVLMCIGAWNLGLSRIYLEFISSFPNAVISHEERNAIRDSMRVLKEGLKIPWFTTFITVISFQVYIMLLSMLPFLINHKSNKPDDKNKVEEDKT